MEHSEGDGIVRIPDSVYRVVETVEVLTDPPYDGSKLYRETPVEFYATRADARLLLYQRCLDAGWTKARAGKYINRHLPQ